MEEYILPFMALSYLFLFNWLNSVEKDNAKTHPAKYAIVYGIVLAVSFHTRLTNALGVCSACTVIGIWLICNNSWKNLGANVLSFLLGFAIIFAPFAIYFATHGAFGEMWYGTIGYNLDYAKASGSDLNSISGLFKSFVHFIDTWLLLLVSILILVFNRKRWLAGVTWLIVSLISGIWFLRGFGFAHYGIISLPLIIISFLELRNIYINQSKDIYKVLGICVLSCYTLIVCASSFHSFNLLRVYIHNTDLATLRQFMRGVPKNYKQSFIAYNCSCDYYLYNNIRPYYRYFTLQDFQSSSSLSLQKRICNAYNGNCRWILVKGQPRVIQPILKRRYSIYKKDASEGLMLYRLKGN